MKAPLKITSILAAFLAATSAFATTSDVVGYISIDCLGGSDTIVSLPLPNATDITTTVASVNAENNQVTLALDNMSANEYQDSHFALFGDNALEGAKMTISANTSDTLTLDVQTGYDLTNLTVGDTVDLIAHTTLSEMFSSVSSLPDGTEVLFFDNSVNAINKSSSGGYIYYTPDWYDANTFAVVNGAVIFPDDTLVVRVPGDASNDFSIVNTGTVHNVGHSFPIVTSGSGASDNFVSPQVPAEVSVSTLYSNPADGDEVLIFDNTVRAINKSSSGGYIYYAPDWYDANTFAVVNDVTVKPWQMAVYRRSDQSGASSTIFSGRAAFLNNL